MNDKIELKTVNTITGEVFSTEVDPYDPMSLANCLRDIKAMMVNLEDLEDNIKAIAEGLLKENDYKPIPMSDGYEWKLISGHRKSYSPGVVLSHLDQDMLITSGALTISGGRLEKLMAELVSKNELPTEDSQAILGSVEMSAIKPYVKLERAVRKAE